MTQRHCRDREFCGPSLEIGQSFEAHLCTGLLCIGSEGDSGGGRLHELIVGIEQAHLDLLRAAELVTVVELEAHFHLASCVGLLRIELGSDDVVAHESLGSGHEINITVETTHVESVLSFEIRGICPTDDLHGYLVFTSFHRLGDVEFSVVVAAFGVADVLAIDPNVSTTVDAIEVEEDILLVPISGEVEGATIAAHRVGVYQSFILIAELDEGWFVVEDVVYIDINGLVVAFHFPARGHFDVVPLRHVKCGLHKRCVALGSIWSILELPLSIECEELRLLRIQPGFFVACIGLKLSGGGVGDEGGVAALLVDAKNHFIFPLCRLGRWMSLRVVSVNLKRVLLLFSESSITLPSVVMARYFVSRWREAARRRKLVPSSSIMSCWLGLLTSSDHKRGPLED